MGRGTRHHVLALGALDALLDEAEARPGISAPLWLATLPRFDSSRAVTVGDWAYLAPRTPLFDVEKGEAIRAIQRAKVLPTQEERLGPDGQQLMCWRERGGNQLVGVEPHHLRLLGSMTEHQFLLADESEADKSPLGHPSCVCGWRGEGRCGKSKARRRWHAEHLLQLPTNSPV